MKIIYKKNAFQWNVLMKFIALFFIFFIFIRLLGYTSLSLCISLISIVTATYLYNNVKNKFISIPAWTTRDIKVDTIYIIGNDSLDRSSIIDSVIYMNNHKKIIVKNIEMLFFPFYKKRNILDINGLNINAYSFDKFKIYINPSNLDEAYFGDDLIYQIKILKKIYVGLIIIFFIPIIINVLKLIWGEFTWL